MASSVLAQDIILPPANRTGGMPLMQAITERRSHRSFSDRDLSLEDLSQILYAAFGLSASDKYTIPTSMGKGDLKVYAVRADGIYAYIPQTHTLKQIADTDVRSIFNTQDYMSTVPLILVYTGTDKENAPLHAGSAYQNVGLYAASAGLNSVVRGYFDEAALAQVLPLEPGEFIIVSQAVGYPTVDE